MANEILLSGLNPVIPADGDPMLAETLAQEYALTLADRAALQQHPALMWVGDVSGSGADTIKLPRYGWGADGGSVLANGENAAAPEIALADDSAYVTVARQAMTRTVSDLLAGVDPHNMFANPALFVMDAVQCMATRKIDLACTSGATFTNDTGPGSGVDADVTSLLGALITLDINNAGNLAKLAVLHSRQFGDIQQDIANSATGVAFKEASQELIMLRGTGFRGSFLGLDIFTSNLVNTANGGADYEGFITCRGGLIWASMAYPMTTGANVVLGSGADRLQIGVEFERESTLGTQLITHNAYFGVDMGDPVAGVSYTSDA